MGKWTPDYIDDVLHSKIKNLVSGAIKRSALESTDPRITYEDFVQDLDTGDSFTTSLIDILVKELAERRTRPRPHDRRYIAPRSAKSLQDLSQRTFDRRDHSTGPFRRYRREGLSDYPPIPPVEMDTEEDEESFENMLDNVTPLEGVRLNTEIYEAYGTNDGGVAPRPAISPALIDGAASPPPPPSAVPAMNFGRSGPWSMANNRMPPSPAHPLHRQPSIRRPFRSSRAYDFNDFTLRRRSAARDNLAEAEPGNREPLWGSSGNTLPARRFFPVPSSRRVDSENRLWGGGSHSGGPWGSMPSPPMSGAMPLPPILPSDSASGADWSGMPSWATPVGGLYEDEAQTPTLPPALYMGEPSSRPIRRIRTARLNASGSHPSLAQLEQMRARALAAADESRSPTPPLLTMSHESNEDRDRRVLAAAMMHIPPPTESADESRTPNEREAVPSTSAEYPTPRTSHEPDP